LLMTYGYRREPFGIQARVSEDNGDTWSEPMIIHGKGTMPDLGYPSTVQLPDGSLISVWYERPDWSTPSQIRFARWKLNS